MSGFKVHNLRNLVQQKICFKNLQNTCMELTLTNFPQSFQNTNVFEMGLSGFHKVTTTFLKQQFSKLKLKLVNYKDYWNLQNNEFRAKLDNEILKDDISNIEYQHFLSLILS